MLLFLLIVDIKDLDLKHRIQWEDTKNPNFVYEYNFLPFDGIPHIIVGHYELNCQFGSDSNAASKEKRRLSCVCHIFLGKRENENDT